MTMEEHEGLLRVLGRLEAKVDTLIDSHAELRGDHKDIDRRVTELETHKKVATTVLSLIGAGAGAAGGLLVKFFNQS